MGHAVVGVYFAQAALAQRASAPGTAVRLRFASRCALHARRPRALVLNARACVCVCAYVRVCVRV